MRGTTTMLHTFIQRLLATLCGLVLWTGAAQAVDVTVSGSLDAGSPTFNRPTNRAGFPASANTSLPYAVVPFRTGASGGAYTFTVGAGTAFDSFLALYSSFDPANPLANILTADDDGAGYPHARVTAASLNANTSYYLVITSFSSNPDAVYPLYGNYSLTLSGDLAGYAVTSTANPVAGGTVSCSPSVVMQGGSSTCTANANAGYSFTGFSGDCSGATCTLSNVSSAKSVTANFSLNSYAVNAGASPVAGGTVSCTPNPVDHGGSTTCTATVNAGYSFAGFSGDCTGASCVLSNVTSAKSVTASFTLNSYAVTATANPVAGGTVSCTPNPVGHGGNSTCTATANAGYTFSGFSGDCTGASCTLTNVTSAKSVTASFTQNTYAITATASPVAGGTVSCTPNPVTHGANASCSVTANAGYTFSSFGGDCTGATCTLSNVTSTKSVSASFTQNTYAITATASPAAGGTVSCTPNPVPHGSSATCTATANANYRFGSFSGDCTGATCTLSNVTATKSITASFVANTAPVASNVTLSGTAQVGSTLTGAYTYADAEGDPQGVSTFRWMADTQASGAGKTALSGATAQTYALGADVQGKYLFFCVTPVATSGVTTGLEVCSAASAAVEAAPVAPPLIPPLVTTIPPGLTSVPPVLNMGGGTGPAVVSGVTTVLQQVLGGGLQFAGQNAQGAVVMKVSGGGNVVFAPLSVQTNDPRPDGLYPTGNGQYQIVSQGTALLVVPTVQSLSELVGLLPAGSGARMESNGVLTADVGGQTYVVQPSVFVQLQSNPGGVPTLTLGADGFLHFTDTAGNSQTLYPAFREADAALRIVQSIDPNATLRIQLDGTAQVRLNGQDLVLVPDLILGGVPAGKEALYWWQESERRYRTRVQANWFNYQSQGFTVR